MCAHSGKDSANSLHSGRPDTDDLGGAARLILLVVLEVQCEMGQIHWMGPQMGVALMEWVLARHDSAARKQRQRTAVPESLSRAGPKDYPQSQAQ